jgi:hypothetical protein
MIFVFYLLFKLAINILRAIEKIELIEGLFNTIKNNRRWMNQIVRPIGMAVKKHMEKFNFK